METLHAVSVSPTLRRFTADEYHAMAEAGILGPEERLELIDGHILRMSPIRGPHLNTVNRLTRLLVLRAGEDAVVSVQNPVRLDDYTEPELDLALLRPYDDDDRVPLAEDALLLVEVAVTTIAYDRDTKLPRYAAAGIPEVWIVLPEQGVVEVYREPSADGYETHTRYGAGDTLRIAALPEADPVPVDAVL